MKKEMLFDIYAPRNIPNNRSTLKQPPKDDIFLSISNYIRFLLRHHSLIMSYATEHIAASLKAARKSKGLSQRGLAQLAGVPQSYISKIERGRIDLRLSSLVDIARALDLELALVPRKAMPAVQSIARPPQSWEFPAGSFPSDRHLKQIQDNLSLMSQANPTLKELAQLQRQVRDLQHLRLPPPDMEALRKATAAIRSLDVKAPDLDAIRKALKNLQEMRNHIAHAIPKIEPPRPAYALDENDNE